MSKIERTTHALLIVTCLAGITALARQEFFPRKPARSLPELLGKHLVVPGLNLPKEPGLALLVAIRSDCPFCEESLPLYRALDRQRKA